jgi:serine/threonine protein phosphatase PrpC
MPHYRNTFGSKSEKSKKKTRNDDALITSNLPQGQLFILSTGVGEEGELAARIIATSIRFYFQNHPQQSFSGNTIKESINYAQQQLIQTIEKNSELNNAGAELIILAIFENKAFFASIGRNNLFFLRNQSVVNLTKHSDIEKKENNKIFIEQYLGKEKVNPYISNEPILLEGGDMFCICSKDVENSLNFDEIKKILLKEDTTNQSKAELLISTIQEKNIDETLSALVVQHFLMEESTQNLSSMENAVLENKTEETIDELEIDEENEKILRSYRQRTLLAFILFSIFILMLYFYKVERWNLAINKMDSLEQVANQSTKKLLLSEKQDKLKNENIKNHYFDSFDNDKYRVYGLLRDSEKKYKISEISTTFNIFNTNAIKVNEVMGEQWFIVPVKGVHFLQAGENATSLAKKYYTDITDSVLIKKFNPNLEPYRHVFIPFNK